MESTLDSSSAVGGPPPASNAIRNDLGRLLSPVTRTGIEELRFIDAIRQANAHPAPESTSSVITRITILEEQRLELLSSILHTTQGLCRGVAHIVGGTLLLSSRCALFAVSAVFLPVRCIASCVFPSREYRAARKVRRARELLSRGRTKKAMELFDGAIKLEPRSLQGFAGRGTLNAALDRHTEAERDFRAAIELFELGAENPAKNETYKACYNGLVFALVRQKRFWEAMRIAARTDKINGTTQTELLKSFVPEIFARFAE